MNMATHILKSGLAGLLRRTVLTCLAATVLPGVVAAATVTLDEVSYSTLPGDRIAVKLGFSGPVQEPLSFAIDQPARVALDLTGVGLNLPRKTQPIGVGMARSVTAVEAGGRTRVVLDLVKLVPYDIKVRGSDIVVTLNSPGAAGASALQAQAAETGASGALESIDFRRGEDGAGRVIVALSNPSMVVDSHEEAGQIVVDFYNAELPDALRRRLDVIDFATPVQEVDTFAHGKNTRMTVKATGNYEHLAYQSDNLFTIDVKPLTKEEEEALIKERFGYKGEKLSLNFQSIEVRAVLQLLADFTEKNLVASDTVRGNLTLRLKNVPWDQALDIILKTKGLAMREQGNVILVAPSEEIAAREKLELEAEKQIEELAPLHTEYIQINYAEASEIASLLKGEANSMTSGRGNVTVDERTNTLLIRDTADSLVAIRNLIATLDVPVRQVLIESRIVLADDTFTKSLGVNFGYSKSTRFGNQGERFLALGGGHPGDTTFGEGTTAFHEGGVENLISLLPVGANPGAALQFAVGKIGSNLLQLELQAAQAEGRGEVLSNPRVITSNQQEATIEQGQEIPFQEASTAGNTSTSFKKAVLSLTVKPQITPDYRIIMDINVKKDSIGEQLFGGTATLDTSSVKTQVLVDNGETVVLGGIYEQDRRNDVTKIPFFGDLPYVGFLFRSTVTRDNKNELLIFVTPKILKESLSLRE